MTKLNKTLYVFSERPQLEGLRDIAASCGYNVRKPAVNEAVEIRLVIEQDHPHITLIEHPHKTLAWDEILEIIRACKQQTGFVIVSDSVTKKMAVQVMKAGALDCLEFNQIEALKTVLESDAVVNLTNAIKTQSFYQRFMDANQNCLFLKDESLRYCLINRSFERFLNRPAEAIIGKTDDDLMTPEDAAACALSDQKVLEKKIAIQTEEINHNVIYNVQKFPVFLESGGIGVGGIIQSINPIKKENEYHQISVEQLESLVTILHHPADSIQEFLNFVLSELTQLTDSKMGYLHFYDEDTQTFTFTSWSGKAMRGHPVPADFKTQCQIDKAGFWAESVRQRRAIIDNDFQQSNTNKKGVPKTHVALQRLLSVPVFNDGRIVAVVGVGNKAEPYTQTDQVQMTLLMDSTWEIIEKNKAVEELSVLSQRMDHYVSTSPVVLMAFINSENQIQFRWCSSNVERILGYSLEEVSDPHWWRSHVKDSRAFDIQNLLKESQQPSKRLLQEYQFEKKDGTSVWIQEDIHVLSNEEGSITEAISAWTDITEQKKAQQQLKRQAEQQENLVRLGRALGSTLDLEMVFRSAQRFVLEMIDAPNFSISLYDPINSVIEIIYVYAGNRSLDISQFPILPYAPDEPRNYRSQAIQNRKPVIDNHMGKSFKSDGSKLYGPGKRVPQSGIYIPMLSEGEPLGVFVLQGFQENIFSQDDAEWLSVVANQIGLAIQNARLYDQSRKRMTQLNGLRDIDSFITAHQPLEITFKGILDLVRFQVHVDAATLQLYDEEKQTLECIDGYGFRHLIVNEVHRASHLVFANEVLKTKKTFIFKPSSPEEVILDEFKEWAEEEFTSYMGIPLTIKGQVKGVMEIFHRSNLSLDSRSQHFLETLAGQAAIAVDNQQLFSGLQDTNEELRQAYDATIEGWSQAMDMRDRETEGHTQRVTELTMIMAKRFNFSQEELPDIRRGALLHDIGKLGVPDQILLKPGPLTEQEWVIMKQHPELAYQMIKPIHYLSPALDIPRYHHERWDGSGYPKGLAGKEIPLTARIFAIVDVWDALTSDRPYRKAWNKKDALEHIQNQSGIHFDPQVVDVFLKTIQE